MDNTEEFYGLIEIKNKISADNGKTFLPSYEEMTEKEKKILYLDIENYIERELTDKDLEDLKEILSEREGETNGKY